MISDAMRIAVSSIESYTNKPAKWTGDKAKSVCIHDGAKNYNLSITDGDDRVLLYCHSRNCDPKDIMESVGLKISDIYHQQLTAKVQRQHKSVINDREIRAALEIELIILLQWLSASNKTLFPCDEEVDRERVMKSFGMVLNACNHYIREGIK